MSEMLIAVALIVLIASWFYKSGKREGSRKGFNAGRKRGQRRR
jgi:hypothetical protein